MFEIYNINVHFCNTQLEVILLTLKTRDMKILTHNSEDFIKSKINYSPDESMASIDSVDICNHLTEAVDRDKAFNEAVDFVTGYLEEYLIDEYSEDENNGCTQIWRRPKGH